MTTKALILMLLLLAAATGGKAQTTGDARCLDFLGMPLEGRSDSIDARLKQMGFTEWGETNDGEGMHYRGPFYGLRSKLIVSPSAEDSLVSQAYVTIGPYRTRDMLDRNFVYLQRRLQEDYGEFTVKERTRICLNDYGIIKLSMEENEYGAHDIKVFYYNTTAFYKDVANMGLHGKVMEIITENPIVENAVEHFDKWGRLLQDDLTDRSYSDYGYLLRASMTEPNGSKSTVDYAYNSDCRLVRRTLTNQEAGIRYINEYQYDDDGEVAAQSQKAFDKTGTCILSIVVKNKYEEFDDYGNWTRNTLSLTYWEKGSQAQQTTVLQKRTISYWDE